MYPHLSPDPARPAARSRAPTTAGAGRGSWRTLTRGAPGGHRAGSAYRRPWLAGVVTTLAVAGLLALAPGAHTVPGDPPPGFLDGQPGTRSSCVVEVGYATDGTTAAARWTRGAGPCGYLRMTPAGTGSTRHRPGHAGDMTRTTY